MFYVQQKADVQQFVRDALVDFHVVVVASADEAMRRLNSEPFDAYVLVHTVHRTCLSPPPRAARDGVLLRFHPYDERTMLDRR